MTRHVKILVTGPFGAGKSRLVRTISEIDVVSTERRLTHPGGDGKDHTTVAMGYGRGTLGDTGGALDGTPGHASLRTVQQAVAPGAEGAVLPCVGTRAASIRQLLARLIEEVEHA